MIRKTLVTVLLIIATATISRAGDLTGHWVGKINGKADISYDFKVDGNKLTGSMTGPDGVVIQITDGVISGDDISFNVVIGDTVRVKGKLNGDVLTVSFSVHDHDLTAELKKTIDK